MNPVNILLAIVILFLLSGIRIIYEYKRAVKFRFGKYVALLTPGIRWIIPLIDKIQVVDIRVITINIQKQEVMTQDNVPCHINGVLFFKIEDATKAVLEVENFEFAISQMAQAT
jgi:regulator of protease activity HflC (stomatin/prohibitin superfamily)